MVSYKLAMKSKAILVVVLVLVLPFFLNSYNNITVKGVQEVPTYNRTLIPSALAKDFRIQDVDSKIYYNLTDFLGKVVLIDLWATWCGPCIDTIPILRDLYKYYTDDMIQIISVDVDNTETDSQVSNFRNRLGMDWIVGIDYDGSIWEEYGNIYIPQFYIVNQTGHIVWDHIGSDLWPEVLDNLRLLLPDDVTDPVINEFSVTTTGSELSIFENSIDVYANITEERYVQKAKLIANTSAGTYSLGLEVKESGDIFEIDESWSIFQQHLFGVFEMEFKLEVEDIWNNTIETPFTTLNVTEYVDTEEPSISNIGAEIIEVDENTFTAYVYAEITDDLIVMGAFIELLNASDVVIKTKNFAEYNATHMKATLAELLYEEGQPHEFTIKITATDIAGKTTDITIDLADEPPPAITPEDTNLAFVVTILALLTFGSLVFRIRRR